MTKQEYIVYDGRAALGDTSDAVVVEALGAFKSDFAAMNDAYPTWKNYGHVLFACDVENGNQLVNERLVGVVDKATLKQLQADHDSRKQAKG